MSSLQKKVVVIGGGTGIYPVTAALKQLPVEITTIVAVSDSGGSTGRIRDEFGFQPVGDLRQSLTALAEGEGQDGIRQLLLYRFDKGEGLKGHSLGNLILTALQDMTGSTTEALKRAAQIFQLQGTVVPAANEVVDVTIQYEDGTTMIGEDYLNGESALEKRVVGISLTPTATASQAALTAIEEAEMIVIGPGDYYGSLLATLMPDGLSEALQQASAKIVLVGNLMTRRWQTDGMTARDHLVGIEQEIGRQVDVIILNNSAIPSSILEAYADHYEFPVEDDLDSDPRVISSDIIADVQATTEQGDSLQRSYLRHDSQKIKTVLAEVLKTLSEPDHD